MTELQKAFVSQWEAVGGKVGAVEDLFPAANEQSGGYETRVVPHMGGNRDRNICREACFSSKNRERGVGTGEKKIERS